MIIFKVLITIQILLMSVSALAADGGKIKAEKPTLGNARSLASTLNSIDSFMVIDRSANIGEDIFLTHNKARHHSDDRKVKDKDSPRFLDAVGRLTVKNSKGETYICGGSLVAFTKNQRSRIIVTSHHCLRGDDITWITLTKSGKIIKRKILMDPLSSNRSSDYAILLLDNFVETKDVMPLIIDFEGGNSVTDLVFDFNAEVHVAGYSADAEVGQSGKNLTYDTTYKGIRSIEDSNSDLYGGYTKGITTYGGASGGAVILSYEDDWNEVNLGKQHVLVGIIKGGASNDFTSSNGIKGSNNTRFVYYKKFIEPLFEIIKKYNGEVDGIEW